MTDPARDPRRLRKAVMSAARPSLRFYHSAALRTRADRLLAAIEGEGDPTAHAGAFADLVVELAQVGMEYYFLKPIKQAKLGFMSERTATLGMGAAHAVLSPLVHRILGGASGPQLRTIAAHFRHLRGEE